MDTPEISTEKMKRFDDVFKMIVTVMAITTSIGLKMYSGINLLMTLAYFIMALGIWMFGHLTGSKSILWDLEIPIKLTALLLSLLVTSSTIIKFAFGIYILDFVWKILVVIVTAIITYGVYRWFGVKFSPKTGRQYKYLWGMILVMFLGGYLRF